MATIRIIKRDRSVVDVLIDDEDWDEVSRYRWHMAGGKGSLGKYVATTTEVNKNLYLHRFIAYQAGLLPSLEVAVGMQGKWEESVDHINGDKLDNRRSNLRIATRQQQATNRNDALPRTNSSGFRGVSFSERRAHLPKPWYASAMVGKRSINLGHYATADEAWAARQEWERTGVIPAAGDGLRSDNTSGHRGVYFVKRLADAPKPWMARGMKDGQLVQLGYYATREEAIAAREAWERGET
jgi:HNH endonuclease